MIYGQVSNIFCTWELQSLKNIFLVGLVNSRDIHSIDFAVSIVLQQVDAINGSDLQYKAKIKYFCGDTLASQGVGGFIEYTGNANYPCRECKVEKSQIGNVVFEKDCQRRSMAELRKHAALANKGIPSFGVKRESMVLQYEFDVINQTPQDIMHVLHEGVARKLVMIFFNLWIDLKRTTISEINFRLSSFKYGYTHSKNKLRKLNLNDLKKKTLVISSGQMHSLILLFPLIFCDILDTNTDEYV